MFHIATCSDVLAGHAGLASLNIIVLKELNILLRSEDCLDFGEFRAAALRLGLLLGLFLSLACLGLLGAESLELLLLRVGQVQVIERACTLSFGLRTLCSRTVGSYAFIVIFTFLTTNVGLGGKPAGHGHCGQCYNQFLHWSV